MLNFPYVCRLCLIPTSPDNSIEIFDETNEIPDKILELTDIQVLSGDGLPQEVCGVCRHHLDLSVTFRRQISQADLMLREHLASTQEAERCKTPTITGDPLTEEERNVKPPAEEGEVKNDDEEKTKASEGEGDSISEKLNVDTAVTVSERNEEEADWAIAEPWPAVGESESANGEEISVKRTDDDIGNNNENFKTENVDVGEEEDTHIPITHIKLEGGGTLLFSLSEEEQDPDDYTNTSIHDLDLSCSDVDENSQEEFKCPHCPKVFTSRKGVGGHQKEHPEHRKRRDRKRSRERNRIRDRDRGVSIFKKRRIKVTASSRKRKRNTQVKCAVKPVRNEGLSSLNVEVLLRTDEQEDVLLQIDEQKDVLLQTDEQKDGLRRSSRSTLGKAPERHVVPHYSCSKCEKMYNDEVTLENHMRMHHGMTYKCNHCSKKFALKDSLESHIKVHFKANLGTIQTYDEQSINHEQTSESHDEHNKKRLHKCNVCGKTYENRSHLFSHMRCHKKKKSGHECDVCGNTFENRSHLFSHMRSHKSTVHLCEICGKTVSLNTYPAHKRSHQNAESHEVFSCDMCDKKFNNKISLRTHKNSYHGALKFTCEVCGKQFTTMALMRHHQNVHSGKRDHICQLCGRAFTLKVTLKSHMRIHTGEMPYGCENCGKHFTWKTTYRNHVATCHKMQGDIPAAARSDYVMQNNGYAPPCDVARSEVLRPNSMYMSSTFQPQVPPQPPPPPVNIPNTSYMPHHMQQELPLDYSEDAKYHHTPIDYSEEGKYRFLPISIPDTKGYPSVLNLREDIKYPYQQPLNFSGDVKLYKDVKSPT